MDLFISDTSFEKYMEFILNYINRCDPTHGIEHIKQVAATALVIARTLHLDEKLDRLITLGAYSHELLDAKQDCFTREFLEIKFRDLFNPFVSEILIFIATTVGFTKVVKFRRENIPWTENVDPLTLAIRNCISDADLLDALGRETDDDETNTGFERMYNFHQPIPENILEIMISICQNKFFILVDEKFIVTEYGIEKAKIYQERLKKYMNKRFRLDFLI